MGGRGSGRRPAYSGKATTEDSLPLDIRRLRHAGVLAPGLSCGWSWTRNDRTCASIGIRTAVTHVTLTYRYTPHGQSAETIAQTIAIDTTPCTLGGSRHWLVCPSCRERVAVIYGAGPLFACRRCNGLAYTSQTESADDRAARRPDRIRKRLDWDEGILNEPGEKPKGMHWRTCERLRTEHDAFVSIAFKAMAARLGLINKLQFYARSIHEWLP